MKKTLEELRNEIDIVDEELLNILSKRMDLVREIGKFKKENNIIPLDKKRFAEILERIIELAKKHSIPQDSVKKIYEEIHNAALTIEKDV